MKMRSAILAMVVTLPLVCIQASAQSAADPRITAFVARIRAVDNHSHANSVAAGDSDADALALDGVPFELPVSNAGKLYKLGLK